jgi:hypothetical protein
MLIPCPACSCHIRANAAFCPLCDAPLKSDSGFARTAGSMLLGLAALSVPLACSSTTKQASGGAGGSSSSSSVGTGGNGGNGGYNVASAYGVGPSSSSGPFCDSGQPGTSKDPACASCISCAEASVCGTAATDFAAKNGPAWVGCVYGDMMMMGCPKDDPMTPTDEHKMCLDACDAANPDASAAYLALIACEICSVCPTNCNSDSYYGDCSKLP